MNVFVCNESSAVAECFVALITDIWIIVQMLLFVSAKVASESKSFAAYVTAVGGFACVCMPVFSQRSAAAERFVARFARKRSVLRMNFLVSD